MVSSKTTTTWHPRLENNDKIEICHDRYLQKSERRVIRARSRRDDDYEAEDGEGEEAGQ